MALAIHKTIVSKAACVYELRHIHFKVHQDVGTTWHCEETLYSYMYMYVPGYLYKDSGKPLKLEIL